MIMVFSIENMYMYGLYIFLNVRVWYLFTYGFSEYFFHTGITPKKYQYVAHSLMILVRCGKVITIQ